jgi:hypothetical protein
MYFISCVLAVTEMVRRSNSSVLQLAVMAALWRRNLFSDLTAFGRNCFKIAITLIDPDFGEQRAQAGNYAC